MTADTIANLKTKMPANSPGGTTVFDIYDVVDTADATGNGVSPRQYGAAGNGTTDDTAAIQSALNTGRDVVLSAGTYRITTSLTMSTAGQKLIGTGGIIQIRSDGKGVNGTGTGIGSLAGLPALAVNADNCTVQGVRFENPDFLMDPVTSSAKNAAIQIRGNYVRTVNNTIVSFLHGIVLSSGEQTGGEYVGLIAAGNFLLEMLGAGTGNNADDGRGEDRGDGITCWGTGATIMNNFVHLKDGQDGRIGIHTEGLTDQSIIHPTYETRCTVISGNVIWGKYRRGIVTEEIQNTTISGNTVAGPTWWGICAANVPNVAITGNSVIFDRLSTDVQGASWGPQRGGITLYCNRNDAFKWTDSHISVTGNVVDLLGVGCGIRTAGTDATNKVRNCTITGNTVHGMPGSDVGILLSNAENTVVNSNVVTGTGGPGIVIIDCLNMAVNSNSISGTGQAGLVVQLYSIDIEVATVSGNIIKNCSPGMDIYGVSGVIVLGNTIQGSTGDAIVFNAVNNSIISYNIFKTTGSTIGYLNGTGNTVGNNLTVA